MCGGDFFTEEICSDLNIIGIYFLKGKREEEKEYRDDKNDKNVRDVREDVRNTGFSILSNKKEISNQLRKSKFCEIQIKYGTCNRKLCNFAHSLDELVFPRCAFGENCKKKSFCMFLHPTEEIREYKERIHFFVPENIS